MNAPWSLLRRQLGTWATVLSQCITVVSGPPRVEEVARFLSTLKLGRLPAVVRIGGPDNTVHTRAVQLLQPGGLFAIVDDSYPIQFSDHLSLDVERHRSG